MRSKSRKSSPAAARPSRRHPSSTRGRRAAPHPPASPPCFAHEHELGTGSSSRTTRGFVVKRAYDPPLPSDGQRVLIDRLWPRGLRKDRAKLDEWTKELAPSADLRRWFHADRSRWTEFSRRYRDELRAQQSGLDALRAMARKGRVTLLYAARDTEVNHAVVLLDVLAHG